MVSIFAVGNLVFLLQSLQFVAFERMIVICSQFIRRYFYMNTDL